MATNSNVYKFSEKVIKAAAMASLRQGFLPEPVRYWDGTDFVVCDIEVYWERLPEHMRDTLMEQALAGLTAGVRAWL